MGEAQEQGWCVAGLALLFHQRQRNLRNKIQVKRSSHNAWMIDSPARSRRCAATVGVARIAGARSVIMFGRASLISGCISPRVF